MDRVLAKKKIYGQSWAIFVEEGFLDYPDFIDLTVDIECIQVKHNRFLENNIKISNKS
jgi:hypothetical protein